MLAGGLREVLLWVGGALLVLEFLALLVDAYVLNQLVLPVLAWVVLN